jgi:hypothetical protein
VEESVDVVVGSDSVVEKDVDVVSSKFVVDSAVGFVVEEVLVDVGGIEVEVKFVVVAAELVVEEIVDVVSSKFVVVSAVGFVVKEVVLEVGGIEVEE